MKNIIEEFYYGNIEPQELNTHLTPKLRSKLKEIVQAEEKLKLFLSEESKKILTEYSELYNEFMSISCCDAFISGFKLGAQIALPEKLWFGDIVNQSLPFYGGNITYHIGDVNTENGEAVVMIPQYRGALIKVLIDGEEKGNIVFSPNTLHIKGLTKGVHKLDLKLYTHRFNSFGAVHNADAALDWHGPDAWRTKNESWSYEYRLKEVGILSAPVIKA